MPDTDSALSAEEALTKALAHAGVTMHMDGSEWSPAATGQAVAYIQDSLREQGFRLDRARDAGDAATLDWPTLANVIREVDGNHDLGAGELAERILAHPKVRDAGDAGGHVHDTEAVECLPPHGSPASGRCPRCGGFYVRCEDSYHAGDAGGTGLRTICAHKGEYGTRCGLFTGHQTANHAYVAGWELANTGSDSDGR